MRILGSRGVPARYGGFETLAERLQSELTQRNIVCDVVGTRDVEVQNSMWGRIIRHRPFRSLETPLLTWAHRNRLDTASPDRTVLVVNPINVLTALNLKRSGHYVALHMDGMEDLRSKWSWPLKMAHRIARRLAVRSDLLLVTDSSAIHDWYRQKFNRQTSMIPYGGCIYAEANPTHRWQPHNSSDFFLVVARPEPENQILEICQAFIASATTHRLVVVGAPSDPSKYWDKVTALVGGHPNIDLIGSVWDRHLLCQLYSSTLGVIHGHTVGGTNPALVDALSHGSPVLAHDNVFNREVLSGNGFLWNCVGDLAELLGRYVPTASHIDAQNFSDRYNWRTVSDSYIEALNLQ